MKVDIPIEVNSVVLKSDGAVNEILKFSVGRRSWSVVERVAHKWYPDSDAEPSYVGVYRACETKGTRERYFVIADGMVVKAHVGSYAHADIAPLTLEARVKVLADAACVGDLGSALLDRGWIGAAARLTGFFAEQFDAMQPVNGAPAKSTLRRAQGLRRGL